MTALLELKEAGVKTALASDNTRDQFFAYGDLDMLDVFTQVLVLKSFQKVKYSSPMEHVVFILDWVVLLSNILHTPMPLFKPMTYCVSKMNPMLKFVVAEFDCRCIDRTSLHS